MSVSDPGPGGSVTLRPFDLDDVARHDRWRNSPEHQTEFGDFMALQRRRTPTPEQWQVNGLLGEDSGRMLICLDGEPVGSISWHEVPHGPNQGSRSLSLGIALEPAARGRGVGTRAQQLVAAYLFEQTLVHRVQASTDTANLAEQRALEKAGFTREGVLRDAQFRLGEYRDMIVYSKLRTDT